MAVSADNEVGKENVCKPDDATHENDAAPAMQKGKKPHEKMGEDITHLGWEQLRDKDIIDMRLKKERISKEKCMLRSCIVKYLEKVSDVETVKFEDPSSYMGSWQKHVQSHKNNLQLNT